MSAKPSRVLVWLLRKVKSHAAADAAMGDILEDLAERGAAGRAPRWPSLWLQRQLVVAAVSAIRAAAPRLARATGHTLRDALRGLRRSPAHTLFILLILSAGMAAATVTFSVVDATILRPLPFEESDRIVRVGGLGVRGPTGITQDDLLAIHRHARSLEAVASFMQTRTDVTIDGITEERVIVYGTADLFRVLKLRAAIGELWRQNHTTGDPHVVVISHGLWQERFAGDPAALGREVRTGKAARRIIGVLPSGVDLPTFAGRGVDLWSPEMPAFRGNPRMAALAPLGRLAPGVSLEQATSEVANLIAPLAAANPSLYANWRLDVRPWKETLVRDINGWMLLALGSVALVLLIACANAANLMLTRSYERARELAVRAVLGAPRRQLGAVLLIESLMLAIAASAFALVFAMWGIETVKSALPAGVFRAETIALDQRVLLGSILAAIATGIVCGIVPAWQVSRVDALTLVKAGGAGAPPRRRRWRSVFLVAQVSSVAALLVVCTLFVASFVRVVTIDLGFDRSNLIGISTLIGYRGTITDLQHELRTVPGVASVAAVGYSFPPLAPAGAWPFARLTRHDAGPDEADDEAEVYRVTPDYFDVAGIAFRQGATWSAAAATNESARPIVIDERTARKLFGDDTHVVGRVLRSSDPEGMFTVAGVVSYVHARGPEHSERSSAYYQVDPIRPRGWMGFLVRTSAPPSTVVRQVEQKLQALVPGHHPEVYVAEDTFRRRTETRRFNAALMGLFALLAVLIGCAGVYASVASAVVQQTREIGVRLALGASAAEIRRSVLAQSGRHLLTGLAIGLPAGWLMSRGFGSIFFNVAPGDLSIYAVVAAVLATVGLLAAAVPARRASRLDPVASLRAQ
ncbi:MAG: ABC transporter permease [Vicinamibacterales bacterium]